MVFRLFLMMFDFLLPLISIHVLWFSIMTYRFSLLFIDFDFNDFHTFRV